MMKRFLKDPMSILLAIFSLVGMQRSLMAIVTAMRDESSNWQTAALYLLLILVLFLGVYMFAKGSDSLQERKGVASSGATSSSSVKHMIIGAFLVVLALSSVLNAWFAPVLRPDRVPSATATSSPTPPPAPTATPPDPTPGATATRPAPTSTPASTPSASPTRKPAGVRMEVIVARVHVRQSPTSQSSSRGELNNGDWLYFDARVYDSQGTAWLRIASEQDSAQYEGWAGMWVYSGGLNTIAILDLPLLPATATPSG